MLQIVATQDLKLGMFISELDRPWLDSPFLLQGFLLEEDEQIETLRNLCRFVTVDRSRSIGDEYQATPASAVAPSFKEKQPSLANNIVFYRTKKKLSLPTLETAEERELIGKRYTKIIYTDDIPIEDALPDARIAYKNTQILLEDLGAQISAGNIPEAQKVDETVSSMVECVVRNPDALLWLAKLKRTDNETYNHSLNAAIHLMAFGRHINLPPDELHTLGMGGLLKDMGFIQLPREIVLKPGGLTPPERAVMRNHVQMSLDLLSHQAPLAYDVREIILRHHERLDGSGYPAHLRGAELGLYAEMAGLTDSYCAMSYPRSFRPARGHQWIIDEINNMRDRFFSAPVIDEFIQFVGFYPVGTLVELNSGEVGAVYEQNRVRRLKPRIMILLGPDKTHNTAYGILNLLSDPLIKEGTPYRITRVLPPGSYGLDPKEFYL